MARCDRCVSGQVSSTNLQQFLNVADVQSTLANLRLPFLGGSAGSWTGIVSIDAEEDEDSAAGAQGAHRVPFAPIHDVNQGAQGPVPVDQIVLADGGAKENALTIVGVEKGGSKRWTASSVKQLSQLSQEEYGRMNPAQCALVASKTSKALAQQLAKHSDAQKQVRLLKRKLAQQQEALQKKQKLLDKALHKSGLEIVPVGRTGKRMTSQSAFAIGIRRNLSNIAAADFGSTILQDISHQRVNRSEVKTGAAILARMRQSIHSAIFGCQPEDAEWSLFTFSFRCDATNSSIWKRQKLHVLDVDFAYIHDHVALCRYDPCASMKCMRCLCEPLLVG